MNCPKWAAFIIGTCGRQHDFCADRVFGKDRFAPLYEAIPEFATIGSPANDNCSDAGSTEGVYPAI